MRARWAALGAAVAVAVGAGGAWVTHAASPPSSVVLIEPARVLDTRDGIDLGLPGPFVSPVSQELRVTGDIPTANGNMVVVPDGATGVLLNVTPVRAEADGFISVRPAEAAGDPTTSNVNFAAGQTNPNSVQVEVPITGPGTGEIEITYDALGVAGPTTDVLVDVVGYTLPTGTDPDLVTEIEALRDDIAALERTSPFVVSDTAGFSVLGAADTVVASVDVDLPSPGSVSLVSTVTAANTNAGQGLRCSLSQGTSFVVSRTQTWQSGGAASGQDGQVAGVRHFEFDSAGSQTFNLVCQARGPAGVMTSVDAISLVATFTPVEASLCAAQPNLCNVPVGTNPPIGN